MTEHVREHLSPFLDGELPALERGAVELHLQTCQECAAHLEELAAVDALARDLPAPAPADGFSAFPARVRARIAAHGRRRRRVPVWGLAAAAALLLAVITPLTLTYRSAREASRAASDATGYPAAAPAATLAASPVLAPPLPASPAPSRPNGALEQARELGYVGGGGRTPTAGAAPEPAPAKQPASRDEGFADEAKKEKQDAFAHHGELRENRRQEEASRPPSAVVTGARAADSAPAPTPPPAAVPQQAVNETLTLDGSLSKDGKIQPGRDKRAEARANPPGPPLPAAPPPPAVPPASAPSEADQRLDEREAGGKAGGDAASKTLRAKASVAPAVAAPGTAGMEVAVLTRSYEALPAELRARRPDTPQAARDLREAWRRLAQARPEGTEAEEARTRTIDVGWAAWQLSGEAQDRSVLLRDIADYLARKDAPEAERMRRLRQSVERP